MKKLFFLLILCFIATTVTLAQSGSVGNLSWSISGGTLTISGSGAMPNLDGNAAPWYWYRSTITTVDIDNGVTSIGGYAFKDYKALVSVSIGNAVKSIDVAAFNGCSSLTSVVIPGSVTIIGRYAFANCTGLTSFTIPDSVTKIENNAFDGCTGFTSVTIGNGVKSIEGHAFRNCSSLATLNFNAINCTGGSDDNHLVFENCTSFTTLRIGDSVQFIDGITFRNCSSLTSVTIGKGVKSIGGSPFYGCNSLTVVNYNAINCADFGSYGSSPVFSNCTAFATLNIGELVQRIPAYAFRDCRILTTVTIPPSVTSIGYYAFAGCSGLNYVAISGSISQGAFSRCNDLSSVTIRYGVTSIGNESFFGCSKLTAITIPNSVTSIGNTAFYNCSGLTAITIPNSVTSIGNNAFSGSSLTTVTIPNSVTSIGYSAFSSCSSLTSVTIPNSVTSISSQTFYDCSSLATVTIGNGVTSIGDQAFSNCGVLKKLRCVAKTPPHLGYAVFTTSYISTCVLEVPAGSKAAYQSIYDFRQFAKIIEMGSSVIHNDYTGTPFSNGYNLGLAGANLFSEQDEYEITYSEELLNQEIDGFINDYGISSKMSDYFSAGQPGMCSVAGMPVWTVNLYDLKLYVRDIIFRKKGIGPEIKLALNYIDSGNATSGMFGSNWKFEYEMSLLKMDSSFVMKTGQGTVFRFNDSKQVQLNTTPFVLSSAENPNLKLQWNGSQMILNKLNGKEIVKFISADGNMYVPASEEDSYGNKVEFQYDEQYRLLKFKDAAGRTYNMHYTNNLCDSIIAPDNRFAVFSYDSGQLASSVDFEGIETTYTYDSVQNITAADIGGKITRFNYTYDNSFSCINNIIDPEQRKTVYYVSLHDDLNSITTVILPDNKSNDYKFYKGNLQSVSTNSGDTKKIYYNGNQQIDSLVWYDGSKTEFAYDNARNVIYSKKRNGEQFYFEYDANNNLIRKTDDKGKVLLRNTYNNKNQIVSLETPDNQTVSYTYDSQGALLGIQTSGGKSYSLTRDMYGNVNSFTNPLGKTLHFTYNETGMQPVEKTDFLGNKYKLLYNKNGKLTKISMPDGSSRNFYYDCCTQTALANEKGQLTSVIRDATNRILEKNYPDGKKINFRYDEKGLVNGYKSIYGAEISLSYNNIGKLTSVSDDDGTVRYNYNKSGLLDFIIDKLGNTTWFGYDNKMRLISRTNAMGYKKNYSYDENNQLTSISDNGIDNMRSFKYDNRGNIIEKSYETNVYASYSYDADNLMNSFTDETGTTNFIRDKGGFIASIVYPGNKTVSFEYDDNGNLKKTIYPNGFEVINQLNNLNRITDVKWENGSVSYVYDEVGNTLSENRYNLVNSSYLYNTNNILIKTDHDIDNSPFFSEEVSYESGIVKSIQIKSPIEVVKAPFTLTDAAYNSLNQMVSCGLDYDFIYDKDGNMTDIKNGIENKMKAAYSPDNMLTYLKNGSDIWQVTYDAMRYPRRLTDKGEASWLYYDHKGRLLFEADATGNISRNYIYRGKRLIAYYDVKKDESYYYHFNRNGNTVAITDRYGETQNAYVYSIGGQILGNKENLPNRNTFLGAFGAIQLDNDFVLTGSRVYSPSWGRFIQPDPLGFITGTNSYLYADNNPASGIDPYGLANNNSTINTLDFDPPSDNNYETAGGTSNPYNDDSKYRDSNWDVYGGAMGETLDEFSNNPIIDLFPGKFANPIGGYKLIDEFQKGNYGNALWQLVPFNNSLESIGKDLKDLRDKFYDAFEKGLNNFEQQYKQCNF